MGLSPNPVVVLGTFRGGTSCVATALNHLGVFLGPENEFQPASEQNPGGFWELRDMQKLNARALLLLGMDYFRAQPLPPNWRDLPGGLNVVDDLHKMLLAKFDGHGVWGWKEPSATLLMPLYKEALALGGVREISSVICVRHPLSVAASQKSRYKKWGYQSESFGDQAPPPVEARTVGLWVHYTLTALKDSIGDRRQVVVYESFLKDPSGYVETMSNALLGGKPDAAQRDAAIKSVKPELSHSRYGDDALKDWPAIVGKVYDFARRLDSDQDGFQSGKYDDEINALYKEWELTGDLARPFEFPAAQMHFVWLDGESQQRVSHPYMQTGGWQIVRQEIPAAPNSTIQIDPCQLPCRIWIRKAAWKVGGQELPAGLKPGPNGVMERFGILRLSVLGPAALLAITPEVEGPATLEIEMLVQSGEIVLREMVMALRKR